MKPIVDKQDEDLLELSYSQNKKDGAWICRASPYRDVLIHRIIAGRMGLDPTLEVDHKDRNPSNNRRSNLRSANRSQNCANVMVRSKSGYKGVYKMGKRWSSQVRHQGKLHALGTFDTPEEAARAYDKKAIELHGEFARTNFGKVRCRP